MQTVMKPAGVVLIVLAMLLWVLALSRPVTTGVDSALTDGAISEVANLSLQHAQLVWILIAGFLFVAGAVLFGCGAIRDEARLAGR